ncbi:MAG: ribosome-associated translation inhibitor RaiA [Planctomycetaceae bacterium]|jgi:putative sigma-54 modulation protein|nr:ribosome-associated translation inhibitor RaiA [Planctomycetaceae bacterium]
MQKNPVQINIETRHGEIADITKEKISAKVIKLQRFFERLLSIDIIIDLEKNDEPNVEVVVTPSPKGTFVANHRSNDMFGSVDQVVAKLEQQIKKYKEKIQDHNKNHDAKHEIN